LPPTLHHGVLTLAPRFFVSGRATASQHRSSCRGGQCATAVSSSWGESYLSSLPPLVHAAGHRGQTTHPLKSLAMQRHVLEAGGIVDNPAPFPLLQLGVVYQESIQHAALNAADAKRAKLLLFSDEQAQVRSPCLFSSSPNPVVPSRPTLGAEAVCGQDTVHNMYLSITDESVHSVPLLELQVWFGCKARSLFGCARNDVETRGGFAAQVEERICRRFRALTYRHTGCSRYRSNTRLAVEPGL
jgi:hypothetical protein